MTHPGPEFGIPHGIVCGIMLPYSMEMVGPTEEYACIARRLGYTGSTAELSKALMRHITKLNSRLGLSESFSDVGIDKERYFANVPRWSEISLNAMLPSFPPPTWTLKRVKSSTSFVITAARTKLKSRIRRQNKQPDGG